MKRFAAFLIVLLVLMALALTGSFLYLKNQSSGRHSEENAVTLNLKITEGMTSRKTGNLLYSNEVIRNPKVFYLFARYPFIASIITGKSQDTFKVKAGLCTVKSSMDLAEIYETLNNARDESVKVTIPEGLTASKIASIFEEKGLCPRDAFLKAIRNKDLLSRHNIITDSAEGYLFPDTYEFAENSTAEEYAEKLIVSFEEKTKSLPGIALPENPTEQQLRTRRDLVVLASIIEREYRVQKEAPVISSVFHNRLKDGIGLYSCATVEYVITEILKKSHPDIITYDDLKIDSPYNTYRNRGLPPGAISNPGLTALTAAALPEKTDYYYFRLTDAEKGEHVFTRTLQEHVDEGVIFNTKKAAGR